jgi:DNA phosphorothioation-associated putative methyltransferase
VIRKDYFDAIAALPYGKRLPAAIYLLDPQNATLPRLLLSTCQELRRRLEIGPAFNLLKFNLSDPKISFLSYPAFDKHAHPELARIVVVDLVTGKVRRDDYDKRDNPPILHRKETFVPTTYLHYELFKSLTEAEENIGLLDETARIGFKLNWERILSARGVTIHGHRLVVSPQSANCNQAFNANQNSKPPIRVARHKTALLRTDASRPVKLLLELQQLRYGQSFFDYGCGFGRDVEFVSALGYEACGWDPAHAANKKKLDADVVNLGYVLNVIEDPVERVDTLVEAWRLTRRLLVVSTLISGSENYTDVTLFGDGVLTKRATFQKYFEQGELHALLEDTLHQEAVPVALGVFFVFKLISDLHDFLESRSRRFIDWNSISRKFGLIRATARRGDPYEEHRELLEAFWGSAIDLGRLPRNHEFEKLPEVRSACGSLPKAFELLSDRFGTQAFEAARTQRREDLLVYAATSQLRKRVPYTQLSARLQSDISSFFGSYTNAESLSRELLFASGDPDELELALSKVTFGKVDPIEGHFTFHRDLLDELPAIFRVYVACGARLFGDPRQADLIKIHLHSRKLTFTHYDDFFEKPFPEMTMRIKIDLRRLFVNVFVTPPGPDRQALLFKERFLSKSEPRRKEMERLSSRLSAEGMREADIGHGPSATDLRAWLRERGLDDIVRKNPALYRFGRLGNAQR